MVQDFVRSPELAKLARIGHIKSSFPIEIQPFFLNHQRPLDNTRIHTHYVFA